MVPGSRISGSGFPVTQRSDSGAIDPLLRLEHAAPFGIPYRSPPLYGLFDSAGKIVVRRPTQFFRQLFCVCSKSSCIWSRRLRPKSDYVRPANLVTDFVQYFANRNRITRANID